MNNSGWEKAAWLASVIEGAAEKLNNKTDGILSALTDITLQITGVGTELIGTTIELKNGENTYVATFDSNLRITLKLDTLGTYELTYQHNEEEQATVEVNITGYGYFEVKVEYFPGYDLWEYWCQLGGLNYEIYNNLAHLLTDTAGVLILMNTKAAVDYMIQSTSVIMPVILATKAALQSAIRNSYCTGEIKKTDTWRTALLNSSVAKTACYEAKDALKSIAKTASVTGVYAGDKADSRNSTVNVDITDPKMLFIACVYTLNGSSSDNGTGSAGHYANMNGKIHINGAEAANANTSAWKKGEMAYATPVNGTLYNTKNTITALSADASASSFGASANATMAATFYYL